MKFRPSVVAFGAPAYDVVIINKGECLLVIIAVMIVNIQYWKLLWMGELPDCPSSLFIIHNLNVRYV